MPKSLITHFQRYEIKYWLTEQQYFDLKEQLRLFVELDPYSQAAAHHAYPIWSLYLDTHSFGCYHERLDGIKYRQKYRLRSYAADKSYEKTSHDLLFLEIKKRQNKIILKDRLALKIPEAREVLEESKTSDEIRGLSDDAKNMLDIFLFYKGRLNLEPKIAVRYTREAYFGQIDKNVRVTFDRNLCAKYCHGLEEMFTESREWFHFRNPETILEIKVYNRMPLWLVDIIRRNHLMSNSISKYCDCVEMVYRELSSEKTGV